MSPSSDQILVIDSNPVDRENLVSYPTGKGSFYQAASNFQPSHLLPLPEPHAPILADFPSDHIPLLPSFAIVMQ